MIRSRISNQTRNQMIRNPSRDLSRAASSTRLTSSSTCTSTRTFISNPSSNLVKSSSRNPSKFSSNHSFNSRSYSTNSSSTSSTSSKSFSSPLSISILISTITLTSLLIYNQSSSIHNESLFDKPSHNQPSQDEFGDVNPSILKGDKNSRTGISMGEDAILTQQEIMRERTRMLGVCSWGSNRSVAQVQQVVRRERSWKGSSLCQLDCACFRLLRKVMRAFSFRNFE